jgi:hypothetical protein
MMRSKRRKLSFLGVTLLAVAFLLSAFPVFASSKLQTDDDGYLIINTAAELDAAHNNVTGKYRLYSDIDLAGYTSSNCTAKKGWKPIAYNSNFTGEFDGNGHKITGLWSEWGAHIGLFGEAKGGIIRNLEIELADAGISGGFEVGGLIGTARRGTLIENVSVKGGKVEATLGGNVGGIVGSIDGSPAVVIRGCYVEGTTVKANLNYAGGLVGSADDSAIIEGCRVEGAHSEGTSFVGGMVGILKDGAKITDSFSSGDAIASSSFAGGMAGAVNLRSSITDSEASGNASATSYAGGLVGTIDGGSKLERVGARGNATARNDIVGGLAGDVDDATIINTYAQGNVQGVAAVGGLVGHFSGSIASGKSVENSYSTGTVKGTGSTMYGAFNGRSGVTYLGANYYDDSTAAAPRAYGSSGNPKGEKSAFPQGLATEQMMSQASYEGWDFVDVWAIDEGSSYPYLRSIAALSNLDSDDDGLCDCDEEPLCTDPFDPDTDDDGIPDGVEVGLGLDPLRDDANEDPDEDGLTNIEEITIYNTFPFIADSDYDGLLDGDEVKHGTDPLNADTDEDGMLDGAEVRYGLDPFVDDANGDPDSDQVINIDEINTYGTDPFDNDSDDDGARDGWEVKNDYDPAVYNDLFKVTLVTPRTSIAGGHWFECTTTFMCEGAYVGTARVEWLDFIFNTNTVAGYLFPTFRLIVNGPIVEATYRFEFDADIYSELNAYSAPLDVPVTTQISMNVGEDFVEVTESSNRRAFILKNN